MSPGDIDPMARYVAFIRAINVAGHAVVKMGDLKDAFAAAGCTDVRTYLASGNVVFEAPDSEPDESFERIRVELRGLLGDAPTVMFRSVGEIDRLVTRNPFRDHEAEPDVKFYVVFLVREPECGPPLPLLSAKEGLEAIGRERLEVFIVSRRKANGYYGFPNNFVEREFGVAATSRSWSTVRRIADKAGQ